VTIIVSDRRSHCAIKSKANTSRSAAGHIPRSRHCRIRLIMGTVLSAASGYASECGAGVGLVLTVVGSDFSSQHLPERGSERLVASGVDEGIQSRVDETNQRESVEQNRVYCCDLPTKKNSKKTNYSVTTLLHMS